MFKTLKTRQPNMLVNGIDILIKAHVTFVLLNLHHVGCFYCLRITC